MNLEDLKNKHLGETSFVIGAGTSLRYLDENILKNNLCIAVNSGILKVPFAQYAIFSDIGVKNWSYFLDEKFANSNTIKLLYKKKLGKYAEHLKNVLWFNHKDDKELTRDFPIINSRTTSAAAIHLLYIMGCQTIVLLGVDCCFSKEKKRYFWEYWPIEKQPYRITGEPLSKIMVNDVNGKFVDEHYLDFIRYWQEFVEINKDILKKELKIIDCSGGILYCFEKGKLEQYV